MFQYKKNILIAIVALLLLSVVLCVFFFQQTPDKKTQLSFAFNTPSKVVEIEFLIFSAAARITITSRYRVTILQIRLYNPVGSFCKVLSKEAENTSELR